MLRSKYRKRRNKKGGRSFMEAFAQGSGDLQQMAKNTAAQVQQKAGEAQRQAQVFRQAHEQELTKTGMDAGFKNPFKKKEDPFERSLENFTPGQKETTNPLFFRGQRARDMTYTTGMKKFKAATGQMGGKRKKRKTRKKRKMRKRKTRKQRKMKKRKTRRKRRR
tara:strand:- start:7988 stop:8479 length:492 start_codon:yes stop_codon:yes gene_type:complete